MAVTQLKTVCPDCGCIFKARRPTAKKVKQKGGAFEREVGKEILAMLNRRFPAYPNYVYGAVKGDKWDIRKSESSGGRFEPGDLTKSERVTEIFPYHIECKRVENWDFCTTMNEAKPSGLWLNAIKQSSKDCPDGETPTVFIRQSHRPLFIIVKFQGKIAVPCQFFKYKKQLWMIAQFRDWFRAVYPRGKK